jgi:hypothetical protein
VGRWGKSLQGKWQPNENGISYLDQAVLHRDHSSTDMVVTLLPRIGLRALYVLLRPWASFPNFLGVIHFPFDRKTKRSVSLRMQIPGHFKTPNCAEMTAEPPF